MKEFLSGLWKMFVEPTVGTVLVIGALLVGAACFAAIVVIVLREFGVNL